VRGTRHRSLLKAVEDLDSPGRYGDRNGVTQAKLQSALGVSQATVSRRCAEAIQAGLIENVGYGRTCRYSATVEPGDDEAVLPRVVTSPVGDRVIEDRGFGEVEAA
jgi:DNA-binding Lrp family transcriptional regulator